MSWAARRKTTRLEDEAYCLLGIFDVNMPMLYGEGKKAFVRLQEEIMSHTTDQTIFAWSGPETQILAPSALNFAGCASLVSLENRKPEGSHEVLKHGLRIAVDVVIRRFSSLTEHKLRGLQINIRGEERLLCVERDQLETGPAPTNNANAPETGSDGSTNVLQADSEAGAFCEKVTPVEKYAKAETAFAVLDCCRLDKPTIFPALKLRVLSWKRRTFALQDHQLIYLQDISSRHLWLECVGRLDRLPFSVLPLKLADAAAQGLGEVGAVSRWVFPTTREIRTVTILDRLQVVKRDKSRSLSFRLTFERNGDSPLKEDGLQLRKCWPDKAWELNDRVAFVKPRSSESMHRFILQLAGANGTGAYILLAFSYTGYPDEKDHGLRNGFGPRVPKMNIFFSEWFSPMLYLAQCNADQPSQKIIQFLEQGEDDLQRGRSREKDHIYIGAYQEDVKHLTSRVDVRIQEAQIAHSRSGIEILVSVKPVYYRSPAIIGKYSAFLILFFGLIVVFLVLMWVFWALGVALIVVALVIMFAWGPCYLLWDSYLEYRDRHRYRS